MAFDDDEDPTAMTAALIPGAKTTGNPAAAAADDGAPTIEDDLQDEEVQDFRKFASQLQKAGVSSKHLRKGEKDFESHGTRLQDGYLEDSRRAMHETLDYERTHGPSQYLRGWYFPNRWVGEPEEDEDDDGGFWRHRAVVVEHEKGPMFKSTGRVMKGRGSGFPAWEKTWLLPEEALFLVERGDLDLWWPERDLEEIFPLNKAADLGESEDSTEKPEDQDDQLGLPLSFQATYALFIGKEGERGKIPLEKYQVYSNLRRSGYLVYRAGSTLGNTALKSPSQSLWQWMVSLVYSSTTSPPRSHPPQGPLVRPGLYRSYQQVFSQLHLIARHKPSPKPKSAVAADSPFRIFYHVYKARPGLGKANMPAPDFRIAVVNARTTSVPTTSEMSSLLDSTPWNPPDEKTAAGQGVGFTYKRLKHGWRNAIVAVVDSGFPSYLRFTEMAFGEEKLYQTFDKPAAKGVKKGRNPQGGRGGRGGRGSARGGRRGG
jgi:tRNA-splicing endonuclease subunit Sen54